MLKKGTIQIKKRPKRDSKSGLGLLGDPVLLKRDPVGSSGLYMGGLALMVISPKEMGIFPLLYVHIVDYSTTFVVF